MMWSWERFWMLCRALRESEIIRVLNQFVYITRVPLSATIKFTLDAESMIYSQLCKKFWSDLDEHMFGHSRMDNLENTILMKFTAEYTDDLEVFDDLWRVIKSITNIKFQHLNYIRHLQIYETKYEYDFLQMPCLKTYNKIMSNIPLELSNEITILSSILEETCFRLDKSDVNDKYSLDENISKNSLPIYTMPCPDPCNLNLQDAAPLEVKTPKKYPSSFQCYDGDYLSMITNMYKPIGKIITDLSLNVLKQLRPFYLLDYDYSETDLVHRHDLAPSASRMPNKPEYLEDMLKLLMFAGYRKEENLPIEESVDFMDNLDTYNKDLFKKSFKVMPFDKASSTQFPVDTSFRTNPLDYYWKEKYPSHVILQELLKVQYDFAYMETVYCPEIEQLLVMFHDDLDDFGINTQIFDEDICTPVCLRDFCKYVVPSKADWLNKNKPPTYVRKIEESEECPGARKIRKQNLFPEYRHLLQMIIEDENELSVEDLASSKHDSSMTETNDVTFDEMISELENYPTNKKLIFECYKHEFPKDFLAYSFIGTKYFAVRGARTTFVSHDNVKIVVDNTKLIDENDKCTVTLNYNNNNLFLHSNGFFKDFYSFHWLLEDGTIIVFEISRTKKRSVKAPEPLDSLSSSAEDTTGEQEEQEIDVDVSGKMVKTLEEQYLPQISNPTHVQKNMNGEGDFEEDYQFKDVYQGLTEAITRDLPIYKVNQNYETIKLKKPIGEIPLVNVIQRVLQDGKKNVCQPELSDVGSSKKYFASHPAPPDLTIMDVISFRMTLPNGIHLTCYPSQIKENLIEIKQEQLSTNIKELRLEEFRLFTREGYILIKMIDGTIRLLMSNGDQIDFENPDTDKEEIRKSRLKKTHCRNLNDYRKKLNKIMKTSRSDNLYYVSRRGILTTKKGYVIDKDIMKILENSKLPYLKTSLISFDGNRTVLTQNKITRKRLYYILTENDFVKEEMAFERKDGLKCVLDKTGHTIMEFSDGTRISTSVDTAAELMDGYVYVNMYYKYEHPYYATVVYEENDLLQIVLNNNVVLEKTTNNIITLTMDEAATTSISSEEVRFTKKCNECSSQYTCLFNIEPFHTNTLKFADQFVHAEDSYDKHFFVDYAGRCENNATYISGCFNQKNCNHQRANVFKRLFSLKKSFAGEQFYTDNMIDALTEEQKKKLDTSVVQRTIDAKDKKKTVLEFRTKYFESFSDRHMTQEVIRTEVTLSKYEQENNRPLYYSTNKFIMQVFNEDFMIKLLKVILDQLSPNLDDSRLKWLLTEYLNEKEAEYLMLRKLSLEAKNALNKEDGKLCKCVKFKLSCSDKMKRWQEECDKYKYLIKERLFPPYFLSEFCQPVNKLD